MGHTFLHPPGLEHFVRVTATAMHYLVWNSYFVFGSLSLERENYCRLDHFCIVLLQHSRERGIEGLPFILASSRMRRQSINL
jgi:hypothetical protein